MSDEPLSSGFSEAQVRTSNDDDDSFEKSYFDMDIIIDCETDDFHDHSVYENKTGLAEDMKFLASMPELCDVTFLVGETRMLPFITFALVIEAYWLSFPP